jgi:hypothetical protein
VAGEFKILYSDLETYTPDHRATIVDVKVECNAGDPFSYVISASLTLTSGCRALSHWSGGQILLYNKKLELKMNDRYLSLRQRRPIKKPTPGQVICTLDDRSDVLQRNILCVQIAEFATYLHPTERYITQNFQTHWYIPPRIIRPGKDGSVI